MTVTLRIGIGLLLSSAFFGLLLNPVFYSVRAQKGKREGGVIRPTPKPTPSPTPKRIIEPEVVFVHGGTFEMGSPEGTGDSNEHPQREVTVPSFYIGKFEITQAEWKAAMGENNNPSYFKGDKLPVENVSWNDAIGFCKKLSQMTGKTYRLPTEAEWEYACRAGTTGDYAGNLDRMAWYGNNSGNIKIDSLTLWNDLNKDWSKYYESLLKNYNQTHTVGGKTPNSWGVYDMHGNVWEWCEDVWHDSYKEAPRNGSAWLSVADSSSRVVRGGSWLNLQDNCRSAVRAWYDPGLRNHNLGFRVVVSARTS